MEIIFLINDMPNIMSSNQFMNQVMNQAFMGGENGVIINQIINLITRISFNPRDKLQFLINILGIVPKIMVMLGAKHLVTHTDRMSELMYETIKKLLYRKEEHIIANTDGLGSYINNILNKTGTNSWSSIRLLIQNDIHTVILYTMRMIPKSKEYQKLIDQANNDKNDRINISANCFKLFPNGKAIAVKSISPNKMFPSKNFIHLTDMINKANEVAISLEYYQVIPILINGEPGLGKSKSLDYLAFNADIEVIRKIDLTSFINSELTLEAILASAMPKNITGHTIIVIDELDKYISSVCSANETPEKINDILLNHVLNLIESDSTSAHCVYIIFCSNNFGTMFDHITPDRQVHYESLKNRFLKVVFNRMDKAEFREYIHWFADHSNSAVNLAGIDQLIDQLPPDFSITSRDLRNQCLTHLYDIPNICKNICSSPEYKIIEKSISPVEKPIEKLMVNSVIVEKPITPIVNSVRSVLDPKIQETTLDNGMVICEASPVVLNPKSKYTNTKLELNTDEQTQQLLLHQEKKQKIHKDKSIEDFGENDFSGDYWKQFYNNGNFNKNDETYKFLQFILNHPNCTKIHTESLISAAFYHYNDILITLFRRNSINVGIYVDWIDMNTEDGNIDNIIRVLNSITPDLITELKKHKTIFAHSIYYVAHSMIQGEKLLAQFNDPTTITIAEWFELPLMKKLFNRNIIENIDKLHELLKYSYTYKHTFYGFNYIHHFNDDGSDQLTPGQKQILSNFLAKVEQGMPR